MSVSVHKNTRAPAPRARAQAVPFSIQLLAPKAVPWHICRQNWTCGDVGRAFGRHGLGSPTQ